MQEFSRTPVSCLNTSFPSPTWSKPTHRNSILIKRNKGANIHKRIHNGFSLNRNSPWHEVRYYISHKNCICQLSRSICPLKLQASENYREISPSWRTFLLRPGVTFSFQVPWKTLDKLLQLLRNKQSTRTIASCDGQCIHLLNDWRRVIKKSIAKWFPLLQRMSPEASRNFCVQCLVKK